MVLVAGSANLDFVVRAAHIPGPGETVLGGAFNTYPGGKGANQAAACARAGGVVTHMLAWCCMRCEYLTRRPVLLSSVCQTMLKTPSLWHLVPTRVWRRRTWNPPVCRRWPASATC